MEENKVILLIDEEYGYRDWMSVLTESEFNEFVRLWKTMKGLSCLVPVPRVVPGAMPSSSEEFTAAIEQAEASGDRVVRVHVHQCDDSFIAGVHHRIPEAEQFEIDGVVYADDAIEVWREEQKKLDRKHAEMESEKLPMPDRAVRDLVLLKNHIMDTERQLFQVRQRVDRMLDDLTHWIGTTADK
ncbi:hypothetical protein EBZ39_04970 [bacterium]|nr:hypothetical protein [bacterium]